MPATALNALERKELLNQIPNTAFDVAVIGGGIMGTGIALDAASRGLKVLLLEKQDFASGTSSRSTKLVHGGLRYLKNYEFGLVGTVARERKILQANALHLVTPEPMLLPVLKNGAYGYWATKIGLTLYDLLAGVTSGERNKMLSASQTQIQEPLLDQNQITGGGLFYEYRTDDARLTLEVLKTAAYYGAFCLNYAEVTSFTFENNRINGLIFKADEQEFTISATCVINAAGPWTAELTKKTNTSGPELYHTKGVHLVVPRHKLPLKQSVYFDVPGGRMLFAIPRNNVTYLGTTDTHYSGSLENPQVEKEDVVYLLKLINEMFPKAKLTEKDITSSWAGIRPLIFEKGKKPTEISRKDEILVSETGLITVAGGKLTGYRHLAEKVVDKALKLSFPEKHQKSKTRKTRLKSGDFESPEAVKQFLKNKTAEGEKLGISSEKIKYLVHTFGLATDLILNQFRLYKKPTNKPDFALLKAEIWYTIHFEACFTISDFLIRRTGRLYFERETIAGILPDVAAIFQELFGLDNAEINRQLQQFTIAYEAAVTFR